MKSTDQNYIDHEVRIRMVEKYHNDIRNLLRWVIGIPVELWCRLLISTRNWSNISHNSDPITQIRDINNLINEHQI